MARDTKARHACGIPAPSYNQLKSLHDVRHYTDAEQALILHRLIQPYNCGDVDIVPTRKTSRPAPTKSHAVSQPARNRLGAKGAVTSNLPPSERKKQDESTASEITISTEDDKSISGTPKKAAGLGGGKDLKSKTYALQCVNIMM